MRQKIVRERLLFLIKNTFERLILTLSSRGLTLDVRAYRRHILAFKVDPRAEKVRYRRITFK